MPILLNIVAYQVAWFACVLGAANQLPWVGTVVALAVVALHLAMSSQRGIEFKLVLTAAVIGLVLDSTLVMSGMVGFSSGVFIDGITPHWMLGLWIGFATTLSVSMRWLVTRPLLAIAFGALGGPVAYYGGMKLGAMTIDSSAAALIMIGIGWAAAMWLLATVAQRLHAAPLIAEPAT